MKTRNSIPVAAGALPFLGHAVPLVRDPLGFLGALPEHGDLVQIRLGPVKTVVVCDPELVRQTLLDERTFDKGGPFFHRMGEIIGYDGLANCPNREHRRQRRLLQPAFSSARFPAYADVLAAETAKITARWRDGQVIDVLDDMDAIAGRGLALTILSGSLRGPALEQAVRDVAAVGRGAFRRMLTPPPLDRLPTPANHRYRRAIARLHAAVRAAIAGRRASRGDDGDLLSAMLAAHDPGSSAAALSDSEIIDNLVTFVFGGSEATASALAWALHLLGQHPDVAKQVEAEADAVLAGAPACFGHLPRLEITRRVLDETMRLYPPGWMFTRTVTADTRLGRHTLPAGTNILYSPYSIHHRSDLFTEPDRFNPDRWDTAKPPRHAFIPFGAGARKCIGDQFSLVQATLALATISASWHLEPVPGHRVRPALAVALRPRGLQMRTVRRARTRLDCLGDYRYP